MAPKRPKSRISKESVTYTDASDDTKYRTHARLDFVKNWARIHAHPDEPHAVTPRLSTSAEHDGWEVDTDWLPIGGRIEPVEVRIRSIPSDIDESGLVVRFDPRPVTAEVIRKLPLGTMLAEGRLAIRNMADLRDRWNEVDTTVEWPDELMGPRVDVGKPKRGQELSQDDLEDVAEVYRAAWANEKPVNEAVRRAFHLSKDGAAKRIGKARAAGLLEGIGPKR